MKIQDYLCIILRDEIMAWHSTLPSNAKRSSIDSRLLIDRVNENVASIMSRLNGIVLPVENTMEEDKVKNRRGK